MHITYHQNHNNNFFSIFRNDFFLIFYYTIMIVLKFDVMNDCYSCNYNHQYYNHKMYLNVIIVCIFFIITFKIVVLFIVSGHTTNEELRIFISSSLTFKD